MLARMSAENAPWENTRQVSARPYALIAQLAGMLMRQACHHAVFVPKESHLQKEVIAAALALLERTPSLAIASVLNAS